MVLHFQISMELAFGYIKINYAKKSMPVTEMKKFFFKGTFKKIKITVIKKHKITVIFIFWLNIKQNYDAFQVLKIIHIILWWVEQIKFKEIHTKT